MRIQIFELRNDELNVNKILAVINATYAVTKRKPEKIKLAGIRTLTSAIPIFTFNYFFLFFSPLTKSV